MYVHPSGKFWKIFLSARILYQPHSYCMLPHHVLQINIFVFYGLIIVFSWWGPGGDQDHNHYHRHVEQRPNHVSMVMWLYGHVFKAVASAVTPTNGSGVEDDYCHVQKTALTVECYMSGITCQGSPLAAATVHGSKCYLLKCRKMLHVSGLSHVSNSYITKIMYVRCYLPWTCFRERQWLNTSV